MRKTKIVCTIGPACRSAQTITAMIKAGMNVARLNFSHGTHEYHQETIDLLKTLRDQLDVPLAIMLDTKGPEIRLRNFAGGAAELQDGAAFTLTTRDVEGNAEIASVTFPGFAAGLHAGDTVLIDDGSLRLQVESVTDTDVRCTVLHGGRISDHKGINVPNVHMDIPALGSRDKEDLLFGIQNDVDFVAASFVRSREDAVAIRKFLDYNGGHSIKLISKIENNEGIENFDAILDCSDGIMVARGDMGVEVEYERLPGLQKRFIRKCYQRGKMVITATQMMDSMISSPSPTRAEITDVANAVFDGTSAVMLSGETAAGRYPVEAVKAMAKIARQAEHDMFELDLYRPADGAFATGGMPDAVCDAACRAARDLSAKAVIVLTKYGDTARRMSKYRPVQAIVAATPERKTYHQLALSWGVYPVMALYQKTSDDLFLHAVDCARQIDLVSEGDMVVIAAGVPLDTPGNTNTLKVERVGKKMWMN